MKKSYLKGVIGAIMGGIIGAIPWVGFSVFNNTMYAILTALIGIGAVKGYELLNGKISKATPWIIGIICLVVITLSNFVFIPLVLFIRDDVAISMANLSLFYDKMIRDLLADYIVGIIFTFLGVSGIIKQMSTQIKTNGGNPDDVKINLLGNNNVETDKIKEYFLKKKAVSPTSAIELTGAEKLSDQMIDLLLGNKTLVLTSDNKYYYDEAREEKLKKSSKKAVIISVIVIAIILVMLVVFSDNTSNNTNKNSSDNTNVNMTIKNSALSKLNYKAPSGYKALEEDEYIYYYPKKDLSGESGFISVSVVEQVEYYDGFTDALKESLKANPDAKVLKVEEIESKNKLKVVMGSVELTGEETKTIDTAYYIFLDNDVAIVEVLYYQGDAKALEKDAKAIVDSFKK